MLTCRSVRGKPKSYFHRSISPHRDNPVALVSRHSATPPFRPGLALCAPSVYQAALSPGRSVFQEFAGTVRCGHDGEQTQGYAASACAGTSGLYQLNCTHTIAFPVSSAGGEAQAMAPHRQAFPTPRGDGNSDPKGGVGGGTGRPGGPAGGRPPPRAGGPPRGTPPNAVVWAQFS